jgi:hypothetical protein
MSKKKNRTNVVAKREGKAPAEPPKRTVKSALRKESDRALVEQIRRLLKLPMNKRTHFLRVRHPGGGSHL